MKPNLPTNCLLDAYELICAVEKAEMEIDALLQHEHEHSEDTSLDLQENNIYEPNNGVENNVSLKRQKTAIGSRLNKRLAGAIFDCKDCDRSFAKIETLKRHKKQAHTFLPMEDIANISPSVPESTQSEDKRIFCSHCFLRRYDIISHERQHTGERAYVCSMCGKLFSRGKELSRHRRIHTVERRYKCTKCTRIK
uniref:C2H2-type domain-containing protein n=1 Tax=Glossina brevipalpis TaxID=37001 RepID=A0A1A9WXU4_9MUSC